MRGLLCHTWPGGYQRHGGGGDSSSLGEVADNSMMLFFLTPLVGTKFTGLQAADIHCVLAQGGAAGLLL